MEDSIRRRSPVTNYILTLTYEDGTSDKVTIDDAMLVTWDKKPQPKTMALALLRVQFIHNAYESVRALGITKLTVTPPPPPINPPEP